MDGISGMIDLPEAFIQRMRRQLGNELPDFLRAMEEPPVRGIRMNPFKSFEGMNGYTSGDPVPWTENGYYLPATSTAGSTVFHEAGAFYLQEPAAMMPAEVLDPKPGELILDLCAAPGGKSTQVGLKMGGKGLLVSNEPVMKRAQILSRNMERIGIPNSVITCMYPAEIPHSWDEMFDGVLVDAPCSGEGMFRRDPQTRSEWSREMSAGCAKRQREILEEASRLLRPGGRMVYSTCTYNPEENEETAREFPAPGLSCQRALRFPARPFSISPKDSGAPLARTADGLSRRLADFSTGQRLLNTTSSDTSHPTAPSKRMTRL